VALLLLLRLWRFLPRVLHDLADPAVGPGFFAVVAGTCVFGSQLIVVGGAPAVARWLWFAGLGLWLVVMYGFFFAVIVRPQKPPLATALNGIWLIAAVATQAVSVLGTLVAPGFGAGQALAHFVALVMFLLGAVLYFVIITVIFYRFAFLRLTAAALTPPYWIDMGAVAIATLAGATLLLHARAEPLIGELLPFIKGLTLLFWAVATWWIPLLAALMAWRHLWRRYPLRYEPQLWALVFPLAMYTAATFRLAQAEHFEFLAIIPEAFIYPAFAAWLLVFAGLLRALARAVRALS
jgi:tellurite resistance protein TehA-like permease